MHCLLSNYQKLNILPKGSLGLLYICLWPNIHKLLLTIRPWYISNWNSRSSYKKKAENHWRILFYVFLILLFLLSTIALSISNTSPACHFDFRVGRINAGTFGAAPTSRCSQHSASWMLLWCLLSDSMSAVKSSSLSFGLCKSPFQSSQFSVSEMLSGVRFSSLSTGWRLICLI